MARLVSRRVGHPRMLALFGTWKPQFRFYQFRSSLLEELDAKGVLLQFKLPDDSVEALIQDLGYLEMSPGGLRLEIASSAYLEERLDSCLDLALSTFEESTSTWRLALAFVSPLAMDYDEARTRGINGWLRLPVPGGYDSAVLLDGIDPETGFAYQCEYGVIDEDEAGLRLSGGQGRLGRMAHFLPPDLTDVPPVGTFQGWTWTVQFTEPQPIFEAARTVLEKCRMITETYRTAIDALCIGAPSTLDGPNRRVTPQ